MKYLVFLLVSLVSMVFCSEAMASMNCVGRYDVNSNHNPVHEEVVLVKTYDMFGLEKYEGQIEEYYFAVNRNLEDSSYRTGIYFGPSYTRGTISTGKFEEGESLKLAVVDGTSVYTILCE